MDGRYYSTPEEFNEIHTCLKLLQCPHCSRRGFLVLHGYLYGYGEVNLEQRGRRIFCNNRKNRSGCGGTFSFLRAGCIRNFMILAKNLGAFLEAISQGYCIAGAARESGIAMSRTSIYRLYKKFRCNQSRIRTYLMRIKGPPPLPGTPNPVAQTINHLKAVFKDCIITRFQHFFQVSIFAN